MDVLVVDPGELGELLTTLLQQYGFDVARVSNGVDALSSALDLRPRVVVVEVELADTSGLDVAELCTTELGAAAVLTHPPGFTADAEVAARVRALAASFSRPFRSLSLIETVARLCGRPLTPMTSPAPLSSTEGYPVDSLADEWLDESDAVVVTGELADDQAPDLDRRDVDHEADDDVDHAFDSMVDGEPITPRAPPPLPPLSDEAAPIEDAIADAGLDEPTVQTTLPPSSSPSHQPISGEGHVELDLELDDPDYERADDTPSPTPAVLDEAPVIDASWSHSPIHREPDGALRHEAVTLVPMPADDGDFAPAVDDVAEHFELEELKKSPSPSSPDAQAELWARTRERHASASSSSSPSSSVPSPARDTEGHLTPRVLADLLDAFHQSQTTGELWLEADVGPGRRVLLLQRGVLVGARSNISGEDLLSRLVKRGSLSREDADHVGFLLKTGQYVTVVAALLDTELVDQATIAAALDEHVRRVAIGAFAWRGGSYKLTIEGRATREQLQANVHVGDVVVHAIVLTETDAALKKAAPDDARFAPIGDAVYGLEHLRLSADEARIVVAMDGTKTIADLVVLMAPIEARVVRGLAAALQALHLAHIVGRGAAAARRISFF